MRSGRERRGEKKEWEERRVFSHEEEIFSYVGLLRGLPAKNDFFFTCGLLKKSVKIQVNFYKRDRLPCTCKL